MDEDLSLDDSSGMSKGSGNLGTGAVGIGMGINAIGSFIEGSQQKSALDYAANVQAQNASEAITASRINAQRQQLMSWKAFGSINAGYSASGVDLESGSVASVLGASAASAEFDRQNILYGGQVRAINYENQAQMDRVAGERAQDAGFLKAGLEGGAAALLLA